MSEHSPIRAGFEAVNDHPIIVAIEIAWRWTFGSLATILLLLGVKAFLAGLTTTEGDEQALRGHDPTMIAAALTHILQQRGTLEALLGIIAAVAFPSGVIWLMAATLGRAATLRRLMPGRDVNTKAILGLNLARAGVLVLAVIGWYVWMLLCGSITITPNATNYPLYVLLSLLALPVIGIVWGLLNWILSLAPVLAMGDGTSAWKVYSKTLHVARRRRGEFTSASTWLGLPRVAAMLVALFVVIVTLVATDSVLIGSVILTVISLAYCAFADYLYVVRLSAYAVICQDSKGATAANQVTA